MTSLESYQITPRALLAGFLTLNQLPQSAASFLHVEVPNKEEMRLTIEGNGRTGTIPPFVSDMGYYEFTFAEAEEHVIDQAAEWFEKNGLGTRQWVGADIVRTRLLYRIMDAQPSELMDVLRQVEEEYEQIVGEDDGGQEGETQDARGAAQTEVEESAQVDGEGAA